MMVDVKTKELIAIGASVSANCQPCVRFHLDKAKKLKIAPGDIQVALQVGTMVRGGAAGQMDHMLSETAKEIGIDRRIFIVGRQSNEDSDIRDRLSQV
ncbi:MAG: carboxymuconolactone decarboxylase family protein [Planctomycetota bacterium]|jgi:AhpD family alkylhydroperoxidase